MSVGKDEADRIAHLARLRFGREELARITAELNHILEHVKSLEALDSSGEAAAVGAGHLSTGGAPTVIDCPSTRGGAAEEPDHLGYDLRAVAPDWREGFFAVPPLPGVHEGEEA